MKLNRRNTLIGLGAVATGAGAAFGSGAFTTVQAERTVSIETADDADAFLALEAAGDTPYVNESGDTIEILLDGTDGETSGDGLSQNAVNTFEDLVEVTNNGTDTVTSLTLEFTETPGDVDAGNTFSFPRDQDGTEDTVANGEDILDTDLATPESITFGLEVDLIDGGDDNALPENGDYTLTITAETS